MSRHDATAATFPFRAYNRTQAPQQTTALFDHLVGALLKLLGDDET